MEILAGITEPIGSTVPALAEAFHLLTPGSIGVQRLMDFIAAKGLVLWFPNSGWLQRAMESMNGLTFMQLVPRCRRAAGM